MYYMDIETYSKVPISYGAHRYANDPSTKLLLWAYACNDEPVKIWDCEKEKTIPDSLRIAIENIRNGARHVWHNGINFDLVVLEKLGYKLPLEKAIDTMVMAYQAALPPSLAGLCEVLRIPRDKAKDTAAGTVTINQFSRPKLINGEYIRMRAKDDPAKWVLFVNYCKQDVEAMRNCYKLLPKFNCSEKEHKLQLLDACINRHGMLIDTELANMAIKYAEMQAQEIQDRCYSLTNGAVNSVTKRDQLLKHIKDTYGIELDGLMQGDVKRRVDDPNLPLEVRQLLSLRLEGAKTSIKKYEAAVNGVVDGRLKGCLQFRGAARTGRYSGRIFQPQNLVRPTHSAIELEAAIESCKAGTLDIFYNDVNTLLSEMLRGLIIAPKNKHLVVADYSNIEGRVLAWLAGESWKIKAFIDSDNGKGYDLYKMTYSKSFGVKPDKVSKSQRQIGKVEELALGYGGGAGAFASFASIYGIDLTFMADEIHRAVSREAWGKSEESYEWALSKNTTAGLKKHEWIACDVIKNQWRRTNPKIVALWHACATAFADAYHSPGTKHVIARDCYAIKRGGYLLIHLPSGRFLSYPSAKAEDGQEMNYYGVDQYSRKWQKIKTFPAKITENIVQAVACDLLMESGLRLYAKGFQPVLSIHDEYICEADLSHTHKEMEQIMCELPEWASGLPLRAEGFSANRYRKG